MATLFDQLAEQTAQQGPAAALDTLIQQMRQEKNFHRLFDAMMLKKKFEFGLPLVRPTSLTDVPKERREEFEQAYITAAREVGQLLIDNGQLADAWVYFRTIQEKEPVAAAIEKMSLPDDFEKAQELINIALYEGAHPVRGLQFLLRTNGTCNTITTLDQVMQQLSPTERQQAAALMVRHLYDELLQNVQTDVQRRMPFAPPAGTLRELIFGRDWLFQEGNYHIDVSHLNSVVRFSRFLEPGADELRKSLQLAEYGTRLDSQLQYAGEAPFDEFYPAHQHFFEILLGEKVDEAIGYFQNKLAAATEEQDQQMIAYVMVDVLMRSGRAEHAMQIAENHLRFLDEASFSFADLCLKVGRADAWGAAAREKGDLVSFTAALLTAAKG